MRKKIFISCAVLAAAAAVVVTIGLRVAKKGPFTGCVTDARTGAPIENVAVTDGRNVVKTDADGRFKLKGWRKSRFVAVTVPAGYECDAFYLPTAKETKEYDFVLQPSARTAAETHSFLQISDTEINEKGAGVWLEDLKTLVETEQPAFLIHTGDICYEAGLKKHITQMNTETMGCTVRYVIGNHDYVQGEYGEALYESLYGPVWYSFDVGNVHYVVTPFQSGADFRSGYGKNDRWRWLENDLAAVSPEKKVVIFNHTKAPDTDFVLQFDAKKLDLKAHNLIGWIYGHYHYNFVEQQNGVLTVSAPRPDAGGIDSSPAGTRKITVTADGTLQTEMYYYDLHKSAEPQNTVWRTKLPGNILFCDTVYADGRLYTATADDDFPRACGVYCLQAADGTILWEYPTDNSVKNNVVLADDCLYALDAGGTVYCLQAADGALRWKKALPLGDTVGTSVGICVQDGILYAGTARAVSALDAKTGAVQWETKRGKGENSPAQWICAGDKLLVASHWDALAALGLSDGKSLWEKQDEDLRFRSSTPLVSEDGETVLVADDDAVMTVRLSDGEILSKIKLDTENFSSSAQPVCRGNIAYIPTAKNGLVAFNLATGALDWRFETGENILFTAPYTGKGDKSVESTPVLDGDTLVFGANDGRIYAVNAETGALQQQYFAGSAVLGKTACDASHLYAGTFDGYLVCYKK